MDTDDARAALQAVSARHTASRAAYEKDRADLAEAIRTYAPALRQVEVVQITGYTRERIRQILDDDKKRGGAA